MRDHILKAFAGAVGLAAVVASAPALSSSPEDCLAPSAATIFVTIPASSLEPSTVYVTVPISSVEVDWNEVPTSTLTRYATLSSTATTVPHTVTEYISAASSFAGQVAPGSSNDPTITEIATVTITNVNLAPLPSGGSVTYTETPAPNGLLNYVVDNGTTYWLDGQTPAPSESYVYSTRSITVIPISATASNSEKATSTLTIQSTLYITAQLTLTETLSASAASSSSSQGVAASVGTGLPYTKSHGGWNATKSSTSGGVLSSATGVSSLAGTGILTNVSPTLVLYSSLNVYETSHFIISKSSLAAQSGFNAFSTPVSGYANASTTPSDPGTATSSAGGRLTTAVINNQTVIWGGSSSSAGQPSTEPCTENPHISSSTGAPYANSTFATAVRATSAVSCVFTSLSSRSSGNVYGSSSATFSSTTSVDLLSSLLGSILSSASSSPDVNTSTASSSAFGALTSVISSTKLSSAISVGSYSYSSPVTNSTSSSSALGALTSLSSSLSSTSTSTSTSTSDDCTKSTSSSPYSSSAVLSSTASSSELGGLSSLNSSNSTKLSSSASSTVYTSSQTIASSTPGSTYAASTSVPLYSSTLILSPTVSSKTSTNTSSSVFVAPTKCGEQGNFVLNFDDIPPLSIGNQSENTVQPEPVFNPYHQFDFSDGFTVVPPPRAPYNPSSPPLFVQFISNFNIDGNNTQAGPNTAEEGTTGQISDGDVDQTGCFRFNIYGASMGCDSEGPACDFVFSGYKLDAFRNEVLVQTQTKSIPACPGLSNCNLTEVDLDNSFNNLAFVRINVTVDAVPKMWWMDDLRLGWYDNSCTMGLCRQQTPIH